MEVGAGQRPASCAVPPVDRHATEGPRFQKDSSPSTSCGGVSPEHVLAEGASEGQRSEGIRPGTHSQEDGIAGRSSHFPLCSALSTPAALPE